ncbi:MAG TPA: serine/threonine-protein kinase [Polyangiaceae bacterium]|nr:serine/threonine-protein kinase [Polyangiaceae bacterium]
MSIFDLTPPFQTTRSGGSAATTLVEGQAPSDALTDPIEPVRQSSIVTASPGRAVQTMHSAGTKAELPASFLPAASPERIRPLSQVGEGGMGVVHSAVDSVLLRRFAQKMMREPAVEDPASTLRFVEEAQITAQLDHPNIVPVHDLALEAESGKLFFTMKLVDGDTLASVFGRLHAAPLSGVHLERVLGIFLKVCDAVSFAHSRGVVHRDLKPENVMVGSHGQVYVMDWGVALLLADQGTKADQPDSGELPAESVSVFPAQKEETPGTMVGTVAYMAPEQAHGLVEEQGIATDVFGLGAILYTLLTGSGPNVDTTFTATLLRAKSGNIPDPTTRPAWPELPPGLCRITMKALSSLPRDRYESVDALKRDVEEFLRGGGWFQTRRYDAGELVVREGEDADAAFIVTDGACEVYRGDGDSREFVRRVGKGEIFGEMGLLTRSPRVASVVALTETRVILITPEALARELDRCAWMKILVEALAGRFREADQALSGRPSPASSSR